MKKINILTICFPFFFLLILLPTTVFASSVGNKIAEVGSNLAVGTNGPYYAEYPWTRDYNASTKKYIDAREKYILLGGSSDGGEYASCDVGVATIIRSSGADPNFEPFLVPNQWRYLNNSPDWKRVGTYYKGSATSYLRPGDVLVVDPDINNSGNSYMHIWLYLGNEAVRKYHPTSSHDSIEASYNSYSWSSTYPSLFTASQINDSRPYAIFRYSGPNRIVEEKPLDRSGGLKKEEVTCKMLGDKTLKSLSKGYTVIEIVGVILYLFMNIWSFSQAVAASTQEKFKKLGKKMLFRTIALVILLLLPIIIKSILALMKTAGVKQIIDFCIDQFL